MLHQVEHVSLRGTLRIPPAAAVVVDDQHLAFAATIFEGTPCALLLVQEPRRRQALQQRRAAHASLELVQLGVMAGHVTMLPG